MDLRLSMDIFDNEVEISNGNVLKTMPASLWSVNISIAEAGSSPVAAELYFRVLK